MKGGTHNLSQFFNRFSIRIKILILVLTSIIAGILLSYVSRNGLLSIEKQLQEITLTTNVERSAHISILQEKDYLLNSNGATYNEINSQNAFAEAKKNIEIIRTSLNEINGITTSPKLLTSSDSARKSSDQYEEMYKRAVNQLVELNKEGMKLEQAGEIISQAAEKYVMSQREQLAIIGDSNSSTEEIISKTEKLNIATDIWKLTFTIRANEKRYMLFQKEETFESMKKDFQLMMNHLENLKSITKQKENLAQIATFKEASQNYERAAYKWVELHKSLYSDTLPTMKKLGDIVLKEVFFAAQDARKNIELNQSAIIELLIIVTIISVIFDLIIGGMVTNSITASIEQFQTGMLEFFKYLNGETREVHHINIDAKDEMKSMTYVINHNIDIIKVGIEKDNALIAQAVSVAEEIKKGNLSIRITKTSNNAALNDLRDVINSMLDSVHKNIGNISNILKIILNLIIQAKLK